MGSRTSLCLFRCESPYKKGYDTHMRSLTFVLVFCCLLLSPLAKASDLAGFLRTCAWGTLAGALVGTASLIAEDKPSEHTINIARGASLGLYAGILYGISNSSASDSPVMNDEASFWLELPPTQTTSAPFKSDLKAHWVYRF